MSFGVQVSDIEARWRPLDVSEANVAETLIGDAELLLSDLRPEFQTLYAAGSIEQRRVTPIVSAMVQRVLRNPDALSGQAVEDISQTFAGPKYDGRLYLTEEELAQVDALIVGARGETSSGAAATVNSVGAAIRRRKAANSWNTERSPLGGTFR